MASQLLNSMGKGENAGYQHLMYDLDDFERIENIVQKEGQILVP